MNVVFLPHFLYYVNYSSTFYLQKSRKEIETFVTYRRPTSNALAGCRPL